MKRPTSAPGRGAVQPSQATAPGHPPSSRPASTHSGPGIRGQAVGASRRAKRCRGAQGLWPLPPDVLEQVRVAWKAARAS